MELFYKGNAVKLLSHHNMFLLADVDQKTIRQSPDQTKKLPRHILNG
ncbi:BnaA07g09170D [Brassica napus]|uniref:BnaA07g09170D protein n=1 Tax=Brassica napus TaxID=3708 RepID=A0A078HU45_BRANA|nr:BnaA07g09170D [Brassica napus]